MYKKKNLAAIGMSITMAITLLSSTTATAQKLEPNPPLLQQVVQVSPRYKNISHITSYLDISDGVATVSGSFSAYENHSSKLTLTLQSSSNGATSWKNEKTWSQSYSGSGFHGFGESKSVESGKYYRCKATVSINGEIVDCLSYVEKAP